MSPQAARRFLVESGFGQVKVSTHNAHYVWHHTYRLWRFRKREAQERQPLPMIPWVLTLMEQLLLPVNPTRGECISSVAIKS